MLKYFSRPGLSQALALSLGAQAIAYAYSTFGRPVPTEHFYDISGSATHLVLISHALATSTSGGAVNPRVALMGTLSGVWAARLGAYLYDRVQRVGSDVRFNELKQDPLQFTVPWILQAFWCFSLQAPLVIAASSGAAARLTRWDVAGASLFAGGLLLETVADAQKDAFKRRRPHEPIMDGVFAYSVYPNYFGEAVLWWGQFMLAAPAAVRPWQLVASALAPVFDGLLLAFVSGLPMSERSAWKKYGASAAYLDYRARTSTLFPMAPAPLASPEDMARVRALAAAAAASA